MQSGSRRQVVDLGLLPRYGIPALATDITATMMAEYPISSPVLGVGVYRDATNPSRVLTEGGTYLLPDAANGTAVAGSARELAPESFGYLTASAPLPLRMTSGEKSYVLLEGGWLEVSAADYPAALTFTSLPSGAARGDPYCRPGQRPALHPREVRSAGLPRPVRHDAGGFALRSGLGRRAGTV